MNFDVGLLVRAVFDQAPHAAAQLLAELLVRLAAEVGDHIPDRVLDVRQHLLVALGVDQAGR